MCLEGYAGPLCENCAPSYYGNPKKDGCTACPAGMVEKGMLNRLYWSLVVMVIAFAVGAAFVFLLFKSSIFDQFINFFYRVRTNPVMALTQVRTIPKASNRSQATDISAYEPIRPRHAHAGAQVLTLPDDGP